MNNDQRDQLIQDTHDAVILLVDTVSRHDDTLYGSQGVATRLTQVETKQTECPARAGSKSIRHALISAVISAIVGLAIGGAVLSVASKSIPSVARSKTP